jgi:glycosyltransferase involved in cell wall biosynthesis
MNTLSLCMIVKDEENEIRNCLESVINIVDEIIIVDTGSTDNTKEICKEFNSKIYDYEWNDDFSAARNFSISKASSDWILWMDADEVLVVHNKKLLNKLLSSKDSLIYTIKMLHYNDTDQENFNEHYISYHHRLFRNHTGIMFEGKIHEHLNAENRTVLDKLEVCSNIEIHHTGYLRKHIVKKSLRNLNLLIKEKELNEDEPWFDYHIAAELYRLNDITKSFQFLNYSIALFLTKGVKPPALLYKLKYDILINTKSLDNAYNGIEKAIELYPDYVELHFYRGVILYQLGKYEDAINAFSYCIILGENNINYLIKSGTGSFYAYYYIGECYYHLNKYAHAITAYQQAFKYNTTFGLAKDKLEELKDK